MASVVLRAVRAVRDPPGSVRLQRDTETDRCEPLRRDCNWSRGARVSPSRRGEVIAVLRHLRCHVRHAARINSPSTVLEHSSSTIIREELPRSRKDVGNNCHVKRRQQEDKEAQKVSCWEGAPCDDSSDE
ncbi:hypothetical protein RRG08_011480 [Elysia crispata]|uniref:Uncharacterized protein n=1 Tax=Elysia crispata TaxID=231223 RepID=A0AAE1B8S5_9GAST|nr:hypothetical protein RRG08_011480 [Elysia crispata]